MTHRKDHPQNMASLPVIFNKKFILFDGISGIPLGKEIHEAFLSQGVEASYLDNAAFKRKYFYKVRSAVSKVADRWFSSDEFYYHPQLVQENFVQHVKEVKPDIIFVIGFLYRFLNPDLIRKLKKELNFTLILYDTDSCNLFTRRRELIYFMEKELPLYDQIFSFSKITTDFINNSQNCNAAYFPFGAKPIPADKSTVKDIDISFVGSADMRRIFLLEKLKSKNLVIYGSKWKRNSSLMSKDLQERIIFNSIWGQNLHQLLHKSKIILNITRSTFHGVETGLNLRIFETLAARGFLLTDYCEELVDLFKTGEEIETYRSSEELLDKVDYYLKHEDKREKIAQKGHELYLKKFTWETRIKDLLSKLN